MSNPHEAKLAVIDNLVSQRRYEIDRLEREIAKLKAQAARANRDRLLCKFAKTSKSR